MRDAYISKFLFSGRMMMFSNSLAATAAFTCLLVYLSAHLETVSISKHFFGFIENSSTDEFVIVGYNFSGADELARRLQMLSIDWFLLNT